jgi:hypothetical protein
MGCLPCHQRSIAQLGEMTSNRKQPDTLSGKNILDSSGNKLLVTSPIRDVYGDIIGYITKKEDGSVMRIFAKNVVEIIER